LTKQLVARQELDDFDEVGMPRLLSLNVGLPRDVTWNGKTVRTGGFKATASNQPNLLGLSFSFELVRHSA
jgi:hypothetical protein